MMGTWRNNPACDCSRCRHGGLMGPAVLVTLGVLLLLSTWHVVSFGRTWPVLLIVIGAVRVLWYAAGTSGHLEGQNPPGAMPPPPGAPPERPDNSQKQVEHV
jgi:hypothetical protein